MMRKLLLAAAMAITPTLAMADASISGQWQASLGHKVIIAMDVLADGHWTSQTVQDSKVVAELAGTYEQKKESPDAGVIVFTPVKSKTSAEHGEAKVESDRYKLENGGKVLRLVSDANDVMVFQKQTYAK